jgi:hypothetical protein
MKKVSIIAYTAECTAVAGNHKVAIKTQYATRSHQSELKIFLRVVGFCCKIKMAFGNILKKKSQTSIFLVIFVTVAWHYHLSTSKLQLLILQVIKNNQELK